MEQKLIQLLTAGAEPEWFRAARAVNDLGCRWVVSSEFAPAAAVILIPRREMIEHPRDELSKSKAYVLVDERWTALNLKRALHARRGALFLDTAHEPGEIIRIVAVALARQNERERHAELMQMMRVQNRRIDEFNQGLAVEVRERTANEMQSRRESQLNITRVRDIIGFIKQLAQVFDIADLLPLIRRQVKEHHALGAPYLFVPRGEGIGDLYYARGFETLRSRVRGAWESSDQTRVHEPADRQFLANATGRPFGKTLRFPLITGRHQREVWRAPLLLFEQLGTDDPQSLTEIIGLKMQPVSWALDRLVLEQELKNTSRDWEMTFDELTEPIAVLDHDGRVLRANSHWSPDFAAALTTTEKHIRRGDRLYTVEKYPISITSESPPLSWVVYLRDETRSRKLKSQVVQVEKMSAIGQLAGHIAHELNNPLTGIRSLTQVLLTETEPAAQVHKDLDEVERASARCQGIINNLLDFSRGGIEHKTEVMDLNEITRRTLPFLKSATGRFRSDVQLSEAELPVKVEPHLMQQVIFNLVNNACQAMIEQGEIVVSTREAAPWAILEVQDTGPGVSRELIERIFEPFFTTKPEGEGTGLGLSLSRDFVRQFGGELECDSEPGRGSVFRVRLPLGLA